jgi:hypothetical protein
MEWSNGRYESVGEQLLPAAEVVIERAAPASPYAVAELRRR